MAKEIKAIKCPQCGSTIKTEIKPDVYRCGNCQTEYFLDNDDITVNYNHKYSYDQGAANPLTPSPNIKTVATIIAVVFAIIILVVVSSLLFKKQPVSNNYAAYEAKNPEKEYRSNRIKTFLLAQEQLEKPVVIRLEERTYSAEKDKSKDGYYVEFHDGLSGKQFAEESLIKTNYDGGQMDIRTFSDGNNYIIIDGEIYLADPKGKLENVNKKFFNSFKELTVGIATINFVYDDFGDGMIVMTNDGQKFYVYPLVKKLYTEDAFYDAQTGFGSILPGAKEMTMFAFTGKSNDYPNEKLQLLKVRYQDNGGGPKDLLDNVSWGKDYGGSGIFTERDPYTKVLIGSYLKKRSRILDWKDLTPGRYYFSPDILYGSGNELLIQFKADANPKSDYRIQKMDVNTGQPVWTKAGLDIVREIRRYKSGYIALTKTDSILIMDFKGNIHK